MAIEIQRERGLSEAEALQDATGQGLVVIVQDMAQDEADAGNAVNTSGDRRTVRRSVRSQSRSVRHGLRAGGLVRPVSHSGILEAADWSALDAEADIRHPGPDRLSSARSGQRCYSTGFKTI